MTIADRVKELRTKKGWTQSHLAEQADVSEKTVRRCEAGVPLKPDSLRAIFSALGEDFEQILAEDQETNDVPDFLLMQSIDTGTELYRLLAGNHGFEHDEEETNDPELINLITEILQCWEYAEIWDEVSISNRFEEQIRMTPVIQRLHELGWVLAGTRTKDAFPEYADIKGWTVAHLRIFRQGSGYAISFPMQQQVAS